MDDKTQKMNAQEQEAPAIIHPVSAIKATIAALIQSRKLLSEFTRERAKKQLSVGNLSSIGKELQIIESRLSRFDAN